MLHLKNKSVLIVDDDARNVFALKSYLEVVGMVVKVAENGSVALDMLEQGPDKIDVILLDMMMPVMDGFETLEGLKKNDIIKRVPVIALTAKAMKGDREKCMEAGAWDYVSKPIEMKLLFEKLSHWIQ